MRPEDFMPRLAIIRYLYITGIEESRQPLPMGASAVLKLQDSVEMFLLLAAEHVNATIDKRTDFDKYFVNIDAKLPKEKLFGKASMLRLNTARVSLKHYGILPTPQDIETFRSSVTSFFEDNTPLIFNTSFASITLVDLVQSQDTRQSLKEAVMLMEQTNYDEAIRKIALAFSQLVREYEKSKVGFSRRSAFYFGQPFTFENVLHMGITDKNMVSFVDKVKESIQALQRAVRILSLGLDYRHYSKFQWLAPSVSWMYSGRANISPPPHPPVSKDDCHFCFNFVIDTAIRLQEFDYELEDPQHKLLAEWREQRLQSDAGPDVLD